MHRLYTWEKARGKLQHYNYRSEFRKSAWAACIKRIYEIDPLKCPKYKAQMRIIAFIQDTHTISDIMKAEGLPDFRAPPAIANFPTPGFIDTADRPLAKSELIFLSFEV